jgi:EpsI family protein
MKLANLTSIHNPLVQDHLLFGWLLFAAVLLLLMLVSSRWFDRDADAPVADAAALQGASHEGSGLTIALVLAALLLPRLWLFATEPVAAALPPPVPPTVQNWTVLPGAYRADWQPHFEGATWIGQWRYRRNGGTQTADLAVILFDRQQEGRELVGFGQGAVAPEGDWAVMSGARAPDRGLGQWLRSPGGRIRHAVTWYLVGGTVTGSRIGAKVAATLSRLSGGDPKAEAILISSVDERTTASFLKDARSVQEMADRALGMR